MRCGMAEPNGPLVRHRGVRRFSLAVSVAILVVLGGAGANAQAPGGGEQAQSDDGLDRVIEGVVSPGFDGWFVPGRPTPVKVELSASQLLAGELRVQFDGQITETVPFEIAADTSEVHWVLLDGPLDDALDVRASVDVGGRTTQLRPSLAEWESGSHLLGTLPGVGAGDPPADGLTTRLLGETIHIVELAPALLDLGPKALGALDSVAATADDLAGLSEPHRDAVLGWLADGGSLYVDSAPGPIAGWPEEVQPGDEVVRSGSGTVMATDGQLAAGRWNDVILPAANRSIHEDGEASADVPWGDVQSEMFNVDLGRELPGLPGLLAVLGVYILLVGPVTYLVLRGRAMARWAAVPVLAVLATGVVFVNGDGLRSDTTATVIDIIEFGPDTATATSKVLLASDGGQREVAAPAGWVAEWDETMAGFGAVEQRRNADAVRFAVPAPPGGVGFLGATGPVNVDGALEVTASAVDDGTVTGTVRNTLDVTLEEVAVFAGRSSSVAVGTLEPGGEATFELTGTNQFRFGSDLFAEHWASGGTGDRDVWIENGVATTMPAMPGGAPFPERVPMPAPMPPPGGGMIVSEECDQFGNCTQCDEFGNCFEMGQVMACDEFGNCGPGFGSGTHCSGPGCSSPLVRAGTLNAIFRDRGTNAMASGMITAVGWTSQMRPVLDLGSGVQLSEPSTAVIARAFPGQDGDRLIDAGVVRTLVSGSRANNEGLIELAFRFDLPSDGVDHPDRLRLNVPEMFMHAALVTASGDVVVRDPAGRLAGRSDVAVPPEAVVDGHVFVRGSIPFEPPRPGREMVLYETEAP